MTTIIKVLIIILIVLILVWIVLMLRMLWGIISMWFWELGNRRHDRIVHHFRHQHREIPPGDYEVKITDVSQRNDILVIECDILDKPKQ